MVDIVEHFYYSRFSIGFSNGRPVHFEIDLCVMTYYVCMVEENHNMIVPGIIVDGWKFRSILNICASFILNGQQPDAH